MLGCLIRFWQRYLFNFAPKIDRSLKKIASYFLFLGIAALLLYFSFREIQWSDFWVDVKNAEVTWIVLSMGCGVAAFWVRSMRWRMLIQGAGYRVKKGDAFDAVNIAYLTNFALPRAGEVARCGVLAKTAHVPFDALLGTVALERVFDVVCLAVCTGLVIALKWSIFGVFMEEQIWMPFVHTMNNKTVYFVVFLLILLLLFALAYLYWGRLQKMVLFKKLNNLTAGIIRGIKSGFVMKRKGAFAGYTLALWFLYWSTSWCTILAFQAVASLSPLDALFLMVVGSLGWLVPVQGGIGAFHFVVSLALTSVYALGQTQSMAFATISHESQAVAMILFGLYSMARVGWVTKKTAKKGVGYFPDASSTK